MSSSTKLPSEIWLQILRSDTLECLDYAALSLVTKHLSQIAQPFLFRRMSIAIQPDAKAIQRGYVTFRSCIVNATQCLDYFLSNWITTVKSVSIVSAGPLDIVDGDGKTYKEVRKAILNAVFDSLASFRNVEAIHIDNFSIQQWYFMILEKLPFLKVLTFYRCSVKKRRVEGKDEDLSDDAIGDLDVFRDQHIRDSLADELPPSDFHLQHLCRITIVENIVSPCVSTWQGLINSSSVEEIVADEQCFPLLKVLRRLPNLSKLTTLRLPRVHLMYEQIDTLKHTLVKCPNLIYLELSDFARLDNLGHQLSLIPLPDSVPSLKHITAGIREVLAFLPNRRHIESINLLSPLKLSNAKQYLERVAHEAPQLRRLKITIFITNTDYDDGGEEQERFMLGLLANIFTLFTNLEEFILTLDVPFGMPFPRRFGNKICELITMHVIRMRIKVFKYYASVPGRGNTSFEHGVSVQRQLDKIHCDSNLTRLLKNSCPKLEVVIIQEEEEDEEEEEE